MKFLEIEKERERERGKKKKKVSSLKIADKFKLSTPYTYIGVLKKSGREVKVTKRISLVVIWSGLVFFLESGVLLPCCLC